MTYLLDTHAFLWFINDDESLSATARELIEPPGNTIFLSAASLWELAIKVSLEKLGLPTPLAEFMRRQLRENNIALLPIEIEHVGKVSTLPFHHRDPFDRLIIAQALTEDVPVIGKDALFDLYGVKRHW